MGIRRISREQALQMLFFADISQHDRKINFNLFCESFLTRKQAQTFFQTLVEGVWDHESYIDSVIRTHSSNWKLHRMTCVDRNILRIATFELLYCNDIPPRVSINEAVDVGKRFGTEESGAFINGILDSIYLAISSDKQKYTLLQEITS